MREISCPKFDSNTRNDKYLQEAIPIVKFPCDWYEKLGTEMYKRYKVWKYTQRKH